MRDREPQARHRHLAVQQEQDTRDVDHRVLLLPQGLPDQSDCQHEPGGRAVVESGDPQGEARGRGLLPVQGDGRAGVTQAGGLPQGGGGPAHALDQSSPAAQSAGDSGPQCRAHMQHLVCNKGVQVSVLVILLVG